MPFLYNLDNKVEGLNVVDFPGVDDEDDSIGDLADLLVTVAQIIVFVVDYRYFDVAIFCISYIYIIILILH